MLALVVALPTGARAQDAQEGAAKAPPTPEEARALRAARGKQKEGEEAPTKVPPTPAEARALKEAKAAAEAARLAEEKQRALEEALGVTEDHPASPAAKAFAKLLQEVLEHEITEVQAYELTTLGLEDVETLAGHRLKRRLRIDDDAAHFQSKVGQIIVQALTSPRPPEGVELAKGERLVLSQLESVYEATRSTRELQAILDTNKDFLRTSNWQLRDRAVNLRDDLVEREVALSNLMRQAADITRGVEVPGTVLNEMLQTMGELAPEVVEGTGDMATLVISNESLRREVLNELREVLSEPRGVRLPEPDEEEVLLNPGLLKLKLIEASGLTATLTELTEVSTRLDEMEPLMDEEELNALSSLERRDLVREYSGLSISRNRLQRSWLTTPPAEEEARAVLETQDALLRERLAELGFQGALFAHRYDDLAASYDISGEVTTSAWGVIEEQSLLLDQLHTAQRRPSPLEGLEPPAPGPLITLSRDPRLLAKQLGVSLTPPGLSKGGGLSLLPRPKKGGGTSKGGAKKPKKKRGGRRR